MAKINGQTTVPGSSDIANINASGTYTVTSSASMVVAVSNTGRDRRPEQRSVI